jgi:hypothetical protein
MTLSNFPETSEIISEIVEIFENLDAMSQRRDSFKKDKRIRSLAVGVAA